MSLVLLMRLLLTTFLLLLIHSISGQTIEQDSIPSSNTEVSDSLSTPPTKIKKKRTFKGPLSMFSGNPGRAALYSLVLPGAGQYYNKRFWKIPLFLASEGAAIGVLVHFARDYGRWNDNLHLISTDPTVNNIDGRNQEEVRAKRNSTRTNRDYAIVGLVAVHLIQVADAFVNRHLIEFDVSDNLSLEIRTETLGPVLSFSYSY